MPSQKSSFCIDTPYLATAIVWSELSDSCPSNLDMDLGVSTSVIPPHYFHINYKNCTEIMQKTLFSNVGLHLPQYGDDIALWIFQMPKNK